MTEMTNGLEKDSIHLIDATNDENAGNAALVAECHGDFDDDTAQWDGDGTILGQRGQLRA